MKPSHFYTITVTLLFLCCTVALTAFPRSKQSELEKRALAEFPEFSVKSLFDGTYTASISSWFSDTVPMRDFIMEKSMGIKGVMKFNHGGSNPEESVTFVATDNGNIELVESGEDKAISVEELMNDTEQHADDVDAKVRIAASGIIISGQDSTTRAMMVFGGTPTSGLTYAGVVSKYKEMLGQKVNVWCMPIPTAIEFYCPQSVAGRTKSQRAMIEGTINALTGGARGVNICDALAQHKKENIYLRTDHHWAPLGGYYAARAFALAAGVPFRDLSAYEKKVIPGYVGSMYGYSKDISVKNNPENFVYYIPKNKEYKTTFISYTLNSDLRIVGESKPYESPYFKDFKGSSAYLNFMGTDAAIVKVQTPVKNGRRVVILKDSFGNTLPGYLFYSFEEVHVVDYRYFTKNILRYIDENKITDVLFANNTFAICTVSSSRSYSMFLTQGGGYIKKAE